MAKWHIWIILLLMLPIVFGGDVEVQYSEDNTTWKNVTTVDEPGMEAVQIALQQDTLYYFRARNGSGAWSYTTETTKEGLDTVWLASVVLIPLGLAFLFLYWGSTLNEEQEPMKWFMRFLAIVMVFVLFTGANIVINLNDKYAALQDIFNIVWIQWIFWSLFALFLVWFLYRIAWAMKVKREDDFNNGVLR